MWALIVLNCMTVSGICTSSVINKYETEASCRKAIVDQMHITDKQWSNDNRTVKVMTVRLPSGCIKTVSEKISEQTYDLVWRKK